MKEISYGEFDKMLDFIFDNIQIPVPPFTIRFEKSKQTVLIPYVDYLELKELMNEYSK